MVERVTYNRVILVQLQACNHGILADADQAYEANAVSESVCGGSQRVRVNSES